MEPNNIAVLEFIHARMQGEPGYAFIDPTEGRELAVAGLVELNETIIDDYGALAARLTPSGVWEVENASGPTQVADMHDPDVAHGHIFEIVDNKEPELMATKNTPAPVATGFEIQKGGFEAPARKSFTRQSKFPFEALEVGDSFFVADKTAEAFASTVTAANKRFSEDTGETETYTWKGETKTRPVRKALRKFAAVNEGSGVRVGRTA